MNSIFRLSAAVVTFGTAFAGLLASPTQADAQIGPLQHRASLGAWMDQVQASPFHRADRVAVPTRARGTFALAGPRAFDVGWPGLAADAQDASRRRVFGHALVGSAIPTGALAAWVLTADSMDDIWAAPLVASAWLVAEPLAVTIATRRAGVERRRAFLAALVGVGAGVGGAVLIGESAGWEIGLSSQVLITAGVTALIAS